MVGYPIIFADRLVTTSLPPDVVLSRLREKTDTGWLLKTKPFFGTLTRERFVLHQTPRGSDPFLLELIGDVRPRDSRTEIRLVVRVSRVSILLVLAALGGTIWWWVATTEAMPLLVVAVLTVALWLFRYPSESVRAERALLDILEAR
jgi:hypothetical protein